MSENKPVPAEGAAPDGEGKEKKMTVVEAMVAAICQDNQFISFRNKPMVQVFDTFPHFVPLTKDFFKRVAYRRLGGVSRSRIGDAYDYLESTAPDFTDDEHLILLGVEDQSDANHEHLYNGGTTRVWDMEQLAYVDVPPSQCVWRSPYAPVQPDGPIQFVMDLACGDPGVYDDIMQSMAVMIMSKKPDGVIWWVGDGANGKSTLMDAIYRIFPGQLSSLTVKALTSGTDAIHLNGYMANIVKESSESRVEDTEIYKAIGTHEDFRTHIFYSQETGLVRGNMHHIFSANSIPTFNDKGYSARRRTSIIPFNATFKSDPLFEQRTFTPRLFGELIYEMCRYAERIKTAGFRYQWSPVTSGAKMGYDANANNAEVFAKEFVRGGVMAFDNFIQVKFEYESWCGSNGFVPLGLTNLRRAVQACGFEHRSVRLDPSSNSRKMYILPKVRGADLEKLPMSRPGLYTTIGYVPPDDDAEIPEVPGFDTPEPPKSEPEQDTTTTTTTTTYKPILNDKW